MFIHSVSIYNMMTSFIFLLSIFSLTSAIINEKYGDCESNFLYMGKSNMCIRGVDGVEIGEKRCSILWDNTCSPHECCQDVNDMEIDTCGSHFIEKGQSHLCRKGMVSSMEKYCVPGRAGTCSPKDCCVKASKRQRSILSENNCVVSFIDMGQAYRCADGVSGVNNSPCLPIETEEEASKEVDNMGTVGTCPVEVCCASIEDESTHTVTVGNCLIDFLYKGKSGTCKDGEIYANAECVTTWDGSCASNDCCIRPDANSSSKCYTDFADLGQSHLCVNGRDGIVEDTSCLVKRDSVCSASECCKTVDEVQTETNCVYDFINKGQADRCQGGIEGVFNRPCLPIHTESSKGDGNDVIGTCRADICCQDVIMGHCVENFLDMGKDYLCPGGPTGVSDIGCICGSDGTCNAVDCCIESIGDFSYNYEEDGF